MHNLKRFFRNYIRPMWARLAVVMVLAAMSSSYFFILGYISKVTVDHVLQLKPNVEDAGAVEEGSAGPQDRKSTSKVDASSRSNPQAPRRDPTSVAPNVLDGGWGAPQKSKSEKLEWLWVIFFAYLAVRLVFSAMNWFYLYNVSFLGQRIVFRVRLDLHQKVQKLQMTFFDRQQTGKIMSRILDDVGLLQNEVMSMCVESVRHIVRILIGIAVLLFLNLKLGMMAILALPLYAVSYRFFKRVIHETTLDMRENYSEAYGVLEERIRGIRVVLSFGKEKGEIRTFFSKVAETLRLSVRRSILNTGLGVVCSVISAVASALVLYYGALAVGSREMTIGDLVYFNMCLGQMFMPLIALTNMNTIFQEMIVVISRVFEIMDETVLIQDHKDAVKLDSVRGRVVFNHVWFRYNDRADDVLKDLTFEVRPGTSVAVVGPSGAGKSTLLSLLLRLYEPTQGQVLIDDYDIRDVKISSLRQHISMVPQEPILFSGTIAENIVYGRGESHPNDIVRAAKAAELHDFVMSLPEKYESHVGERGANLSGGQKQRLAFSMALLSDPAILILDDTTSALDARTEARIQETLDQVMEGRTTFVITHRIATAMRADRILVLDNGRMVGWGTHGELVQREGMYRQLYEQQVSPEAARLQAAVPGS